MKKAALVSWGLILASIAMWVFAAALAAWDRHRLAMRPLLVADRCSALEVHLDKAWSTLHPEWPIRGTLTPSQLDPEVICIDDALIRVYIDEREAVVIRRQEGPATSPSPIKPAETQHCSTGNARKW